MVTVILPSDLKVRSKKVKKGQILEFKILHKKHMLLNQFCPGIPMMSLVLVYIYKSKKR